MWGTQGNLFSILNSGDFDSFVLRYTSAGNLLWGRGLEVNAALSDMARTIVIDEVRGSLYVAGDHFSIKNFKPISDNVDVVLTMLDTDIFVEKLNLVDGSSLWDIPFNFSLVSTDNVPQWNFGTGIAVDRDGYVYVGGYGIRQDKDHTSNAGDVTFELFKLDSSSNLFWHSYMPAGPHAGNEARGLWSIA